MRMEPTAASETTIVITPIIDQKTEQQFKTVAIRRLVRKLDRRLLPFLVVLEMSSYINRTSTGHANLMGFQNDLHMSQSESNWAISLFFLAYFLFGIPSNLLLRFIGPTRYISLSVFAWGSITVGMAFVKNAQQFFIIRFFLGMAESGFFPGIIIYFSLWYCKKEQTMRIAILYGAAIFSGAFGGVLAYGIGQMDGIRGLKGWQWLFLLEGLPNIPLGVITYLFLANIPATVQWLDSCERQLLTNLLREDAGVTDSETTSSTRLSWRQVRYVFIDWRIYLYVVIVVGDLAVIKYLTTYFPSLVVDMGQSKTVAHLMTAPPYLIACICCLLAAYSASRRNEHSLHLIICLSVALLGFILMLTLANRGKVALYVSTCVASSGTFSAVPLELSWLTNNVGGHTKRAMAVAFVLCVGQIGGAVLPQVFSGTDQPVYRLGNSICAGMLALSLVVTIVLRVCLMLENRRRDNLSPEQRTREAAIIEPCDWHPDARYVM